MRISAAAATENMPVNRSGTALTFMLIPAVVIMMKTWLTLLLKAWAKTGYSLDVTALFTRVWGKYWHQD